MKKSFIIQLLLSITFGLSFCANSIAQDKFEREFRINPDQVPQQAANFLSDVEFDRDIRWYKEEGLNSYSFEAKTKYRGKDYSIEFNKKGLIEDIEVRVKSKDLVTETLDNIEMVFDEEFDRYRIRKIQLQYTGEENSLKSFLENGDSRGLIRKFEIVVKGRKNKDYGLWEFLFSEKGDYLSKLKIRLRNTDNLEN